MKDTVQRVVPGDVVVQRYGQVVVYSLLESEWGVLSTFPIVVSSIRPKRLDSTLVAVRLPDRPGSVRALFVEVAGGIAGARYELRLSPVKAFEVRVVV